MAADIELVVGDCIAVLGGRAGKFADLAICDPPFNIGQEYAGCSDNMTRDRYMEFSRQWMRCVHGALKDGGTMWIFCPDEWVSELDIMARSGFGFTKRRHVVWAYTFGVACRNNFSRSHCHILYMTKSGKDFVFNPDAVRVPSARQLVYRDKRQNKSGKLPDATWMLLREQLEPAMAPDRDTWLESRVCGTFKERRKHSPNQIPVPLLERIVLSCSNPGDLVLDPFLGTGSSGIAALTHGRRHLGIDVSMVCVVESRNRIAALRDHAGER
jgi:site-specific DNA-methyltransferase (adenine-specific)